MDAYTFSYGTFSGHFDSDDYEDAVRYKSALFALLKAPCPDRTADPAAYVKAYCMAVRAFFVSIFGEGADTAILGEKLNKRTHDEAYAAFVGMVATQVQRSNVHLKEMLEKYSPAAGEKLEKNV